MNPRFGNLASSTGSFYWPNTRIRKKGALGSRQLKDRSFFRSASVYLAVFFLFALGYVWSRVQVTETGYHLRLLEKERERLRGENRALMVEAATLRSPQRLEKIARELGLQQPTEKQVVLIQ